jgi:hypothetical protein
MFRLNLLGTGSVVAGDTRSVVCRAPAGSSAGLTDLNNGGFRMMLELLGLGLPE